MAATRAARYRAAPAVSPRTISRQTGTTSSSVGSVPSAIAAGRVRYGRGAQDRRETSAGGKASVVHGGAYPGRLHARAPPDRGLACRSGSPSARHPMLAVVLFMHPTGTFPMGHVKGRATWLPRWSG